MRVLMISNDLAFLGERTSNGDTINRHCAYGQLVERLAIIVLTKHGHYQPAALSANTTAYPTNGQSLLATVKNGLKIGRAMAAEQPYDLIVCQDPFLTALIACCLKKQLGAQLLIDFHGDFWANPYWLKEKPWRLGLLALSRWTVRQADGLRVVSAGLKQKLRHAGLNHLPIEVIATPVNLEQFKTPDSQTVLSIKNEFSGRKILLFVGRLTPEKNLAFLLRCLKRVKRQQPRALLLIIGSGPEKNHLEKLITHWRLSESVKLLGAVSYQNLLNYFHATDLFVLPSRHESFGKVLLEAAAAGKPAVASATIGAKEIILDGQTGLLAPVNNLKQFTEKILLLLSDEALAQRLGATAYHHVWTKYAWQTSINKVVDYWQRIANLPQR